MATDFQDINNHTINIENFSYDVADMVDSIYIGPQGELMEEIERINALYNCNIGITKSFTLKPGVYNEIKQAYNEWVLRYDMKPRGIKSLFDRMEQYRWRSQGFRSSMMNIDAKLKTLKSSGMRWQDNSDQFIVEFERLKSSIIKNLELTQEMYPDVDISCKIFPTSEGRLTETYRRRWYSSIKSFPSSMTNSNGSTVDFIIMFYLKIRNIPMTIHVMDDGNSDLSQYTLPIGEVQIASGTYLLPLISRHWGRDEPLTTSPAESAFSYFLEAIYLTDHSMHLHPYISKPSNKISWDLKHAVHSGNICTGNMQTDIRSSLLNNEIMAHLVNLITWVTNYYVPQTNPLNRINRLRYYGDDIKFVQWRNDLNSISTNVFQSVMEGHMPNNCSLPTQIKDQLHQYSGGNTDIGYSHNTMYHRGDIEYSERFDEYIETVEEKNLACNTCSFKSECDKWAMMQYIFARDRTPEEEGFIGMMYEVSDFLLNITVSYEREYRYLEAAEDVFEAVDRWNIQEDYFHYVLMHKMVRWWSLSILNEEIVDTTSTRYRRRMNTMRSLDYIHLRALYENEYLNEESDFEWCIDNVRHYRATLAHKKAMKELTNTSATIETIENIQWDPDELNRNQPQGDREQDSVSTEEPEMTPEQRAIQWAINNGGAQNL